MPKAVLFPVLEKFPLKKTCILEIIRDETKYSVEQKGRDQRGLEVSANLTLDEEFEMNLFGCENNG